MRTCAHVLAVLVLAAMVAGGVVAGGTTKEQPDRIADLIRQLGDNKIAKREAAHKDLATIGEPALAALQKAVTSSPDAETRQRAEKLIATIGSTDAKSAPPPKGAIVLFDGKKLDAWVGRDGLAAPSWLLVPGSVMEARDADVRTRQSFAGPYLLHVEFRLPTNPVNTTYGRGNSGVYLHGRYEVQILDSYGPQPPGAIHSAPAESCGAIFGQTAPRINACKAPGFWQSYDIEFHAPRFKQGIKVENARLTVLHNGALIHDKVDVAVEDTGSGLDTDPAEPCPVMLQYHGSPVQFRNIWLLPLGKS
jgi:hypothetical protein